MPGNDRSTAKRGAAAVLLCVILLLLIPRPSSFADVSRRNLLRTTRCADAYTLFEIDGCKFTAVGAYANDRLRRITSNRNNITSMHFSSHEDGSFEAEFSLDVFSSDAQLALEFNSGAVIRYRVRCDGKGWFFPENGLSETNKNATEKIFDLPAEAVLRFLTDSDDEQRARETLDKVRKISDSVTEGISDDRDKARALSRYITENYYYDKDAGNTSVTEETVALENVLLNSRTVCIGFANLYCALLQAQGIDAVVIKGSAVTSDMTGDDLAGVEQNHEFTAFYYEKEQRWVWADPCWCGCGKYENGEYIKRHPHEKFFDITDEALSQTHRADYASRRSFFDENIFTSEAVPETAETTTEAPAETTAPAQTETSAVSETTETSAETTTAAETSAPQTFTSPIRQEIASSGDEIPLVAAVSVLGTLVVVLSVYIVIQFKNRKGKEKMVVIELENGKQIKIELYPEIAPITVKNFEELVNSGFYDGLTFHRVIRGFMIQGGCPIGNGTGNSGRHIRGEFASNGVQNDLKHTRGVVSMARAADPDSASCQFFIMHEDAPHLDGNYAAFGKVVEGMDAVDEIAATETDHADRPLNKVVMKSVKLVEE